MHATVCTRSCCSCCDHLHGAANDGSIEDGPSWQSNDPSPRRCFFCLCLVITSGLFDPAAHSLRFLRTLNDSTTHFASCLGLEQLSRALLHHLRRQCHSCRGVTETQRLGPRAKASHYEPISTHLNISSIMTTRRPVVDFVVSSPPSMASSATPSSPTRPDSRKERRNPSITPRKFRRFFTPRSRVPSQASPARRALRELGAPEINNRYQTPAPSSPIKGIEDEALPTQEGHLSSYNTRSSKRQKFNHTPESSPCRPFADLSQDTLGVKVPSEYSRPRLLSPIDSLPSFSQESLDDSEQDCSEDELPVLPRQPIQRLAPLTSRGFAGKLVQRELGGMPRAGRAYMSFPTADPRTDTAAFYSRPDDVHSCTSEDGPGRCIPFCVAACHTNTLTAVGDEEGRIRLLETSSDASQPFSKLHLAFQAHSNAIIDLAFSDDDYLLATASGDQTGRVIDMMTQTPIANLQQHTASLKQVCFQPGKANSSVLATSSRDGSVQIWDLRCTGGPVQEIPRLERENGLTFRRAALKQGCAVNSIYHAHARTSNQAKQAASIGPGDTPSRGELPGRIGDVSVTAMQFMPPGKEHLLITACEADASLKVWDVRSIHTSRSKTATPLSVTTPPSSHSRWRPFGISSLSLSSDASRLYAMCKDNTVYAYSTAHLMLGHAPEMETRNGEAPRRRHGVVTQQGLGPLYGFRHPSFHATSFYVKCAVRPARNGHSELLAVGSSDSCAVVFPTDERYFRRDLACSMGALNLDTSTIATTNRDDPRNSVRRPLFRSSSSANLAARVQDDIPIVRMGTPLVRGHDREVGALAWTTQGKLVTVGDDYLVRCWSEDAAQAADLRTGGETEGRRWGCGWADVGKDWDVADDDSDFEGEE